MVIVVKRGARYMNNVRVLNNSELKNIEGGWNKSAFEWGKRVGRVCVYVGSSIIPIKL